MIDAMPADVDLVREFRLRRWARQHYVAAEARSPGWHPVVLDEMRRRDSELESWNRPTTAATSFVPLPLTDLRRLDHPHALSSTPNLIQDKTPLKSRESRAQSRKNEEKKEGGDSASLALDAGNYRPALG